MTAPTPQDSVSHQIAALKKPPAGRRWLSWLLFALLLTLALLLPVASSLWPDKPAPAVAGQSMPAVAGMDKLWNPGPISASHHRWADDCSVCHSEPFARVQDSNCQTCHADTSAHASGMMDKNKSHGDVTDLRCASCHREHKGEFGLLEQNRHFVGSQCASCHADIKAKVPDSAIGNASDFGTAHPDFRVLIATPQGPVLQLPAPGKLLQEANPLKFSHAAHLASGGINSPTGKQAMACVDCHRPTSDGQHFEPITMAAQCQSCHALNFDAALPDRQLPHGSVDDVLSTLMEFYSFASQQSSSQPKDTATPAANSFRPGKQPLSMIPAPVSAHVKDAKAQASAAATRLFEQTACVVCHTTTAVEGTGPHATPGRELPQWHIEPPVAQHPWLPAARFKHTAHKSMDCGSCHAASTSKQSSDVLMPTIDTCRSCHAGATAPAQKVPSDCGLCHDFHQGMRASLQEQIQQQIQKGLQHAPAACPVGETACTP
jgi:predicted CXXCH cytochrome family protein